MSACDGIKLAVSAKGRAQGSIRAVSVQGTSLTISILSKPEEGQKNPDQIETTSGRRTSVIQKQKQVHKKNY
jgi:hypothetical protein